MEAIFVKTDPAAVTPSRANDFATGFDMTLIKYVKSVGDVYFYSTCIQVRPPFGYYFDLVGRSSISKTGYMLANSIGIIDQDYTGEVIVALRKVNKGADDIQLPIKLVQLVPRKFHEMNFIENTYIPSTARNCGGFGSTG